MKQNIIESIVDILIGIGAVALFVLVTFGFVALVVSFLTSL
jgi:hypothetical protein